MRARSRACFRFGPRGGLPRMEIIASPHGRRHVLPRRSRLGVRKLAFALAYAVDASHGGYRYPARVAPRLTPAQPPLSAKACSAPYKDLCPEGVYHRPGRRGASNTSKPKPREGIRDFQASRSAGVRTSRWKVLDMLKFRELCRIPELRQDGGSCILTAAEHFVRTFSAWRRGG